MEYKIIQERINWLDWAKFIGITLVVMGHLPFTDKFINQLIYSFHMPLFFILAGFLFKPTNGYLKKNAKQLLLPYLILCFVNYIWWLFVGFLRHPEIYQFTFQDGLLKPILGVLIGVNYATDISYPIPGALWFLIAMFSVKVIYCFLASFEEQISFYVAGSFLLVVVLLHQFSFDLWFSIDSAMLAFPFFVIGVILKKYHNVYFFKKIMFVIAFILLAAFTIILSLINGPVDMNTFNYGHNIVIYYINGFCGSMMICAISMLLSPINNKIVVEIANGTILIIGLHSIVTNGILDGIIRYCLKEDILEYSFIGGVILSVLSVVLFYYPIKYCRIYFPIIIGRK